MSTAEHADEQGHHDEGYDGTARLRSPAGEWLDVRVRLRGGFQPIDGRYHWYGRLDADDGLDELGRSGANVVLSTPHGEAEGRLSDVDPWGRFRIAGTGQPPYQTDKPSLEA